MAALAVAYALWEVARPVFGPVLVVVAVLGMLYAAVMPLWRYAVHRWEATAGGVALRQSLLQRRLGLMSV